MLGTDRNNQKLDKHIEQQEEFMEKWGLQVNYF